MTRKLLPMIAVLLAMSHAETRADVSLDLTTTGASGTVNGAAADWFVQVPDQSTGTGVIDPFLRLQANVSEAGYNTDGSVQFDTKSGTWTHSLNLADVPLVTIGGVVYRQFLLDINQTSANPLLSLNEMEIYLGTTQNFTGTSGFGTASAGAGTLVYDLDATGNNTIELNYALNPGSGAGDVYAYIAESKFSSAFTGSNPWVYLYSGFGAPKNDSNDGFEEWAVVGTGGGLPNAVPEPSSLVSCCIAGVLGLGYTWRRRRTVATS